MTFTLQGSLLDQVDDVGLRTLDTGVRRTPLSRGAWIDVRPGWLTGADELFARLTLGGAAGVDWRSERRVMWDKEVATPRLLRFYGESEPWPDPVLAQARSMLSVHYREELGEPFTTAGMCLYRDGRDSVTWHGDREGRASSQDTMVAIVSIGAPRALVLRPVGGGAGRTVRHVLGHGDLLVMGGSCQRTWEHAVPKTSTPVGPRISIQFRPHGIR
ncbi:alpha-ketoglutarate-dependent dioxygenase AlkB [Allobranchiibius sp. GilTou38]|uniref:alpha-ketoglutarate-dependent dioxygenase AlkB n=1 Tax=Allobranchiibius sp. GilTou38 TaxID=2815210 RepID=UPI001AA18D72|nr:alpha-ketoglutarate-dependent dioxygenase AlkB [Allobranchiibius sp. GilTou38]MBO1768220.1 alpha-ketoglutarate-dependent dioxygenase AlkB [Allobranchiibius sp. GilTou38]